MRTGTEATPDRRSDWAEVALARLAAEGYRAGEARTAVVELLADEGGCLEADQVSEELRLRGRAVGAASVYRALALLSDLGLLQKVAQPDSPTRFELVLPGGEHHHHIVCERCGRSEPFLDDDLEDAIDRVAGSTSFSITSHELTLRGTCESCSG